MATHSSVLAWRIPGTGEPGGLLPVGLHRVRHDWSDLAAAAAAAAWTKHLLASIVTIVDSVRNYSMGVKINKYKFYARKDIYEVLKYIPKYLSEWVKLLSHVQLFVIPWTVAYQAPPSMEFSRQKYWSGLTFPSPGDLPDPGIEPSSPMLQADALTSEEPRKPKISLLTI